MHLKSSARRQAGTALALLLGSACGAEKHGVDGKLVPNDDLGVALAELPLLAAGCSITSNVMTVTVRDGESAYIALRPSDNMITVNGNIFAPGGAGGSGGAGGAAGAGAGGRGGAPAADTGRPCEITAAGSIVLQADVGGTKVVGRSVILDYVNGVFLKAASATTPGIKIDFTLSGDDGSKNSLKIRGSDDPDSFTLGAGTMNVAALNLNAPGAPGAGGAAGSGGAAGAAGAAGRAGSGGAAGGGAMATTDAFPDVTFKNVPSVVISAGGGDDRLDASGPANAGVGAAFPTAVSLFGNDGADVITGGLGDDTLVGGLGADVLNGCQGNDTYDMGAVSSGADVIAEACAGAMEGVDTLDYSKRTNTVTVNLSRTLASSNPTIAGMDNGGTSGETNEGAHISDKIVNIRLGAGDDTLNVPMGSIVNHRIRGGKGDDTYNGLGVQDIFDGELGDDTCVSNVSVMDYSQRTTAITASLCSSSCNMTSDAMDGDQSITGSSHNGSGASTATSGGINTTTLTAGSGFTAASVGNQLALDCGTGATENATYTIVEFLDATSVKLDTTAVSGFGAQATCSFVETLPAGTMNMGASAAVAAPVASGVVNNLTKTTNMRFHTLQLTHSDTSTGGGASHTNDDGTYIVLKVLSATSVAIDVRDPVALGTSWSGNTTAMDWTETGPEHDNVQCAHVTGGSGNDVFTGDARNNVLRGGAGNDTLNGGDGNDTLYGEAGNDNLYGGAGDDTLVGADGTDNLFGGDDNDVLEGDAGNDAFTCDGRNSSTSLSNGTAPGDADFKVDYSTGDTQASPGDCEF